MWLETGTHLLAHEGLEYSFLFPHPRRAPDADKAVYWAVGRLNYVTITLATNKEWNVPKKYLNQILKENT
jgi:hypothetical protein